jgi:hypothetical protein
VKWKSVSGSFAHPRWCVVHWRARSTSLDIFLEIVFVFEKASDCEERRRKTEENDDDSPAKLLRDKDRPGEISMVE